MGVKFAWFYDVLSIAVIFACVFIGFKKGFIKAVVMLCGYIIAISAGYFVASHYSVPIYNKVVAPRVTSYVESSIGDFNVDSEIRDILTNQGIPVELKDEDIDKIMDSNDNLSDGVKDFAQSKEIQLTDKQKKDIDKSLSSDNILKNLDGNINPRAYSILNKFNSLTDDAMNKFMKSLRGGSRTQTATQLSNVVIKPVAVNIIKVVLFILTFIIASILVRVISRFLGFVNKIPFAGTANRVLGGVLGFIQGTLYVFVFSLILKVLILISSSEMLMINEKTINATKIFRLFYNIDLFK